MGWRVIIAELYNMLASGSNVSHSMLLISRNRVQLLLVHLHPRFLDFILVSAFSRIFHLFAAGEEKWKNEQHLLVHRNEKSYFNFPSFQLSVFFSLSSCLPLNVLVSGFGDVNI